MESFLQFVHIHGVALLKTGTSEGSHTCNLYIYMGLYGVYMESPPGWRTVTGLDCAAGFAGRTR